MSARELQGILLVNVVTFVLPQVRIIVVLIKVFDALEVLHSCVDGVSK